MGACWYCHWGWSKKVKDIYDNYIADGFMYEAMHFGPAHIVWEDENFNRESVQFCLDNFDKYKRDFDEDSMKSVRASLEDLLKLTDEELDPEPDDYDGENPEDFPPPVGVEMARKGN